MIHLVASLHSVLLESFCLGFWTYLRIAAFPAEDQLQSLLGSAVQNRRARSPRDNGSPRRRISHREAADSVPAERTGQPLEPPDVDARLVLRSIAARCLDRYADT